MYCVKTRLVIVTEIIAPYRIPVFNALAGRADINLHVIFLAETDKTQREWHVPKDEAQFSYQVLPSWRRRFGGYHCLLNWGMRSALKRAHPDVILCGGYNYVASWTALWWARRKRVPLYLWVESTARDHRAGHTLVESFKIGFMRSCRGFVVPGSSSSEYLRNYGIDKGNIFVAPNAVDTDFFAYGAAEARRDDIAQRHSLGLPLHFFLFVGRLVAEKGIFDLLEAYCMLTPELRSRWGVVFVGGGADAAELQARAATVTVGSVQVAGFAQREKLAKYYGLADVLVMPTHTDPWGLVVNEAMACALPVAVSTAAGCTADLVFEGWNGYLFPAGNTAYLASILKRVAEDDVQRAKMGKHSRERIKKYSPAACADGIATAALSAAKTI